MQDKLLVTSMRTWWLTYGLHLIHVCLPCFAQFLACLLVAGLWHPITAAIAGAVYLIGRIFYFRVSLLTWQRLHVRCFVSFWPVPDLSKVDTLHSHLPCRAMRQATLISGCRGLSSTSHCE